MTAKFLMLCTACMLLCVSTPAFCSQNDFETPLEIEDNPISAQIESGKLLELFSKQPVEFKFYTNKIDQELKELKTAQTQTLRDISGVLAEVVAEFFKGMMPNSTGVEYADPNSTFPGRYVKKINGSKFGVLLQGMADLKYLNGPYYYNEMQGGVGVQYDFYAQGPDGQEEVLLALRFTPAYGEVAYIRTDMGARRELGLPSVTSVGSSAGIEVFKWIDSHVQVGASAYVRPQKPLGQDTGAYFTHFEQIYARFLLNPENRFNSDIPLLRLSTYLSYFDRGKRDTVLAKWMENLNALEAGSQKRNYNTISRSLEGMVFFEVFFK